MTSTASPSSKSVPNTGVSAQEERPVVSYQDLNAYCAAHTSPTSTVLSQLEKETWNTQKMAVMITGKLEGAYLSMICQMNKAKSVLEIGTFTGYSALAMAEALPEDGKVVTLDVSDEYTAVAKSFWKKSPHGAKIDLRIGNAIDSLIAIPKGNQFDVIFIDADKQSYLKYYKTIISQKLLAPDGVILVDNTLWMGWVTLEEKRSIQDSSAQHLHNFNEYVLNDPQTKVCQVPIRDGVSMIMWA